ncbi:MAG: FAD-binding protein [Acidimicrobiia bacterium]|nr:FAD-binding protein [Acidimicrobiia bacterium]
MNGSGLLEALIAALPADCIQTDPDVVAAYAQDRALFEKAGTASVLVMPRTTAEVVAAVNAASHNGVPVVTRGAGTGLTGGANAIDGCLVLSLHRMNEIIEIDATNRMARVQPGVINSDLKNAVASHGLFYPPDPASVEISSIGGNVATNAGGLCCVKYGVTRDYVIGLEVVLASGEVVRTGRRTLKSTTGLDLTGLFIGSEGILGVITEVTVKLVPQPEAPETAVAFFNDLSSAGSAIAEIFAEGHNPSMMEILDRASIGHVERVYKMDLDLNAACLLLMQTDSEPSEAIQAMATTCARHGATLVHHATDPVEGEMLVAARRRVWPAMETLGKHLLPEDVAVPRQRLTEMLAGITEIGRKDNVTLATVGHAGDGNLHPVFVIDPTSADEIECAKVAFGEIVELAVELGGTIAAEHGIGTLKRAFLESELGPAELRLQRSIRDLLDPKGLLNPGKAL